MSHRISRREFLRAGGFVAAAGVLAACAPPSVSPGGGGEAQQEAASPGEEKITLVWDTFRGPGTGWNEERIETFKEKYPNVEIIFRPLTGSSQQDNYGKMYAMHAAGDLGDLIAFDPSHYHFWRAINKGIIMPIDDLIEADGLDLSQWYDMFITIQYYKGNIYGLPSWGWAGFDTMVINAVHFEEEGLEPPNPVGHDTPMDTYAEWAHRFYREGERFGMGVSYSEAFLAVLCRCYNGYLINEEGTKCLLLDDPNVQEGLRWLYQLAVVDKILPASGDLGGISFGSALLEGKLTMNWCGSLCVRNFKRDIQDETKAKAWQGLFPTRQDGKYPSQIRGGTWNIRQGTRYPEMAFQFIKHITSKEGCLGFNLVAGQGALVRPDVLEELIRIDPVHEWFVPNLQNGIPARAPANSRGREYTDAINQWLTIMMDPHQPVAFEQGLQDLNDNIQKVLDLEPA